MPVIPSRDVDKAAKFYTGVLGFTTCSFFRDGDGPAYFAIVGLGTVTIGIMKVKEFTAHEGTVAYVYVDDANDYARQIERSGGRIRHEPHETFYGMIEFDLVDPEGNVLAFGQDMIPGPNGPGL